MRLPKGLLSAEKDWVTPAVKWMVMSRTRNAMLPDEDNVPPLLNMLCTSRNQICLHFAALLILFLIPARSSAQANDACLACHSDESLSMERKGKKVSLTVKAGPYHQSAHGKLACVACHTGFDAENLPHKATITPDNCSPCHKNVAEKHPFHPQMAKAGGRGAV